MQQPGTQTETVSLQQLQGGCTHKVAQIGAGGQQQGLPACTVSALVATVASAIAAIANKDRTGNILHIPS